VGTAAGEEVEHVGDGVEHGLEALDGAAGRAGEVADQGLPTVPQTPRESIPKVRPPALLAIRIDSARPGASRSSTALVPSGVRSRGPNPVPPVVTTSPEKPEVNSRSAAATASTPSAVTRWSTTP